MLLRAYTIRGRLHFNIAAADGISGQAHLTGSITLFVLHSSLPGRLMLPPDPGEISEGSWTFKVPSTRIHS